MFDCSNIGIAGSNPSKNTDVYRNLSCVHVVLHSYRHCDRPKRAQGLEPIDQNIIVPKLMLKWTDAVPTM
jgi:hypothetical protein